MLGKSVPLPAACRFGALPVVLAGRSRGMEPAGPMDEQPPTVAVFRVLLPPPRSPLFALSGATPRVLALVAYASRVEPGSYRG